MQKYGIKQKNHYSVNTIYINYANEKVIGIDITGECSATLDYLSEVRSADINNRANEELMRMILAEERTSKIRIHTKGER